MISLTILTTAKTQVLSSLALCLYVWLQGLQTDPGFHKVRVRVPTSALQTCPAFPHSASCSRASGVPSCHVAAAFRSAPHLWVLPSLEAGSACLGSPRNHTNPWFHSTQPTPLVNRPFIQLSCLFLFCVCHLFPPGQMGKLGWINVPQT